MRTEPAQDRNGATMQEKLQYAALSVAIVALALLAEFRMVEPQLVTWPTDLKQPFFALPTGLFRDLITALSVLMAIAYFRILLSPMAAIERIRVFLRFGGQLLLGALWCYVLFVLKNVAVSLIIAVQFASVSLETGRVFYGLDRKAGLLMIPQILWAVYGFVYSSTLLFENLPTAN